MCVGLPATHAQRIFHLGIQIRDLTQLQECSAIIFVYTFNGLRESTAMSMLQLVGHSGGDACAGEYLESTSGHSGATSLLSSTFRYHLPSDLIVRWSGLRMPHERFFVLANDPINWEPKILYRRPSPRSRLSCYPAASHWRWAWPYSAGNTPPIRCQHSTSIEQSPFPQRRTGFSGGIPSRPLPLRSRPRLPKRYLLRQRNALALFYPSCLRFVLDSNKSRFS